MKEKDLVVEISKEYKKRIKEKFNYKNKREGKDGDWKISRTCPLCWDFRYKNETCEGCPFNKFRINTPKEEIVGCLVWINKIIPHKHFCLFPDEIYWNDKYDGVVKKELEELRKKAKKLIRWV